QFVRCSWNTELYAARTSGRPGQGADTGCGCLLIGRSFLSDVDGPGAVRQRNPYETIRLVVEIEPRNPQLWNSKVDVHLATICLKCLEKDPQRRYPSARELAEDVERWLRREPIRARRSAIFTRGKKRLQRNNLPAQLSS